MFDKSAAEVMNGGALNVKATCPNSLPVSAIAAVIAAKVRDVAEAVICGIAPWFSSAAGIASPPVRDRVVGYSHFIRLS